jgi:hypothetical protein
VTAAEGSLAAAEGERDFASTPTVEKMRSLHRLMPKSAGLASSVLAGERLLPVSDALQQVLPARGLQRGSTVLVQPAGASGSTTFALEMLAGISMGGYWCAVAGAPELGIVAASERGIELERLLLVPDFGGPDRWLQVVAMLFDAVDAVMIVPPAGVRPSEARKLSARAKDRGSLFLVLDRRRSWAGPSDLRCSVTSSAWAGLSRGYGLLRERHYEVEVSGRGAAARPLRNPLRLPA